MSGGSWGCPELSRLLDPLRKDDVRVVWRLDRLSRSPKDVPTLVQTVARRTRDSSARPRPSTLDRRSGA
ncbi:recombinase family protein [Massilia pseudoviolaceinigra]|uniref:recombinase family protein n=1 Tax=Massilia pseudoviolaceinigra TaxID=3057165 RepID=UPI0035B520E8